MLQCEEYLDGLDHNAKCIPLTKQRNTATLACNCLNVLEDEVARHAVSSYMVTFFKKNSEAQMLTVMEWVRYTQGGNGKGKKAMYFLPFFKDMNDEFYDEHTHEEILATLSKHKVCRSAIRILLDFGRIKWRTAERCVKKCVLPKHGNSNKRSNNGKIC